MISNKIDIAEQENMSVFSEKEFFEQFAIEPIEDCDILPFKQGLEKAVINICKSLGSFYDNLNLQKLSQGILNTFLRDNGIKTKKDVYLYLLYRDCTMFVHEDVLNELYKILSSFDKIKQRVDQESSCCAVSLIDGKEIFNASPHILGYCHYKQHRGYVTKHLMDNHECLRKGCPLLEKFEERDYWVKKAEIKNLKRIEKQKKQEEQNKLEEYKSVAEKYVRNKGYNLKVIKVAKNANGGFLIYFVTELNKNEEVKYYDIAKHLKDTYHESFWMRKISKSNGEYATIKDFKKMF